MLVLPSSFFLSAGMGHHLKSVFDIQGHSSLYGIQPSRAVGIRQRGPLDYHKVPAFGMRDVSKARRTATGESLPSSGNGEIMTGESFTLLKATSRVIGECHEKG